MADLRSALQGRLSLKLPRLLQWNAILDVLLQLILFCFLEHGLSAFSITELCVNRHYAYCVGI
jgi:hypothetical protein